MTHFFEQLNLYLWGGAVVLFIGFFVTLFFYRWLLKKQVLEETFHPFTGNKEWKAFFELYRLVVLFFISFVFYFAHPILGLIFHFLWGSYLFSFYQSLQKKKKERILLSIHYSKEELMAIHQEFQSLKNLRKKLLVAEKMVITTHYLYLSPKKKYPLTKQSFQHLTLHDVQFQSPYLILSFVFHHVPAHSLYVPIPPQGQRDIVQYLAQKKDR